MVKARSAQLVDSWRYLGQTKGLVDGQTESAPIIHSARYRRSTCFIELLFNQSTDLSTRFESLHPFAHDLLGHQIGGPVVRVEQQVGGVEAPQTPLPVAAAEHHLVQGEQQGGQREEEPRALPEPGNQAVAGEGALTSGSF